MDDGNTPAPPARPTPDSAVSPTFAAETTPPSSSRRPVATHAEALDYLYGRIDYEKIGHAAYTANNYRLDRMRGLLELLDNPQDKYSIIHVGGTKGKGTVCHLLEACLRECGLKTGLYTSPHLMRLEERFQINGVAATDAQLIELTANVQAAAETLEARGGGRPTFFELTTAIGMLYFAQQGCRWVVLEVGLGGRLDSTNVCVPEASVITSISLDHQKQLGNTIAAIASEKAGIIKPGVPVISTALHPDARQVFVDRAAETESELYLLERDFDIQWQTLAHSDERGAAAVEYHPQLEKLRHLTQLRWTTQLLGRHQGGNVAAVLTTLNVLFHRIPELQIDRIANALMKAAPPARLQVIQREPAMLILDTAHNPASIQAGVEALQTHFPEKAKTVVFASSSDKAYAAMLEHLLPNCRRIYLTEYRSNPRALPLEQLESVARGIAKERNLACDIVLAATPAQAKRLAMSQVQGDELIWATGSFFLAAELLADPSS